MPEKKAFSRLPTNVVPSNYQVKLTPDLKSFKFSGSEIIDVEVSSIRSSGDKSGNEDSSSQPPLQLIS